MTTYGIGLDVGCTNIKAVAVDDRGRRLDGCSRATPEARDLLLERVRGVLDQLEGSRGAKPRWLGLSAPGLAARDARSIVWMQGRMEVLQGLDWTRALDSGPRPWVLNDGHAATLGEAWVGAAAGAQDVLVLTLGTGVGGGILSGGRLLTGYLGRAGHVGHLCLDMEGPPDICDTPGSLECAVGEATLKERSGGRFATTRDLVAAADAGETTARHLWHRTVRALACGLVSLVNVVDPEVVVLGGGIAGAGRSLFAPLQAELERIEWRPTSCRVRVVPAALGEFAGAMGAVRYAMLREGST